MCICRQYLRASQIAEGRRLVSVLVARMSSPECQMPKEVEVLPKGVSNLFSCFQLHDAAQAQMPAELRPQNIIRGTVRTLGLARATLAAYRRTGPRLRMVGLCLLAASFSSCDRDQGAVRLGVLLQVHSHIGFTYALGDVRPHASAFMRYAQACNMSFCRWIWIFICMQYTYIYMYTHMYTHTYVRTYIRVYMYACMYRYIHVYIYI